jgi:hypothetical protein
MAVLWGGPAPTRSDFGEVIVAEFIDGKMSGRGGAWAIFAPRSWQRFGCGRFGEGYGQRYRKDAEGRWVKVEG